MKTISIILAVFVLGFLGWFGFGTPEKNITQIRTENIRNTESKILEAEKKCQELECEIEGTQYEIQKTINYERPNNN